MKTCNNSTNIYQEAINHCRWKKVLYQILKDINIQDYKNKTFEEIICQIYDICYKVNGIGMLTIYDITSAICRYYKINIEKVYVIGNGPKRAIKLLNISTKIQNINNKIKINYVNISDVINAFDKNNYELNENIKNNKNGDILESYICNWQKTK
jgi:hypothetical protein